MSSKTRLANKTIWALEDIITACRAIHRNLQAAEKRATHTMDPVMLAILLRISQDTHLIDTLARDARRGDYRETTQTEEVTCSP